MGSRLKSKKKHQKSNSNHYYRVKKTTKLHLMIGNKKYWYVSIYEN